MANLLCKKLNSHGLTDPARLKEARARCLGELTAEESNLARISRPDKVARGTSKTRQGCKRHQKGGSANLRFKNVNSHQLADPARLKEARAMWLGELAVQEIKLARTRQGCKRHKRGGSANLRLWKVNPHRLDDPTMLKEARVRWLGELAVMESTANLRSKKVISHGLADPARLHEARARWLGELAVQESKLSRTQQGCKRHERGGSANLRCMKLNSHGLADRARLQEAPARWLGELKVQESKTAQTRLGYKRHEGGGSANLRCKKVISHGLADPARLHDARARRLGELAVQESKLAGVSIPDKVARGTSEVARRACGARK
ncbi:hypothetical protein CDL15_Pgr002284 [Punica granatum]|uniref:Uncharacterized protein n=1 Tax=Punica granatum TaxID=22663 RepID=A0A218XIA4_PUNGR|nr:hypothetical protein CDL15_Pgr002284 [Punica granatum]